MWWFAAEYGEFVMNEYLDDLESRSIYIIREAYREYRDKLAVLWSIGKDSTTLLHLVRKAFFGKVPIPVIHIDTSFKFPEIYEFRDKYAKEWNLKLIVARNEKALSEGVSPEKGKLECCTKLKTEALKQAITKYGIKALLLGIRRDEHGIRAKERYFCFPRGTLVYGKEIKPIEKIQAGDLVFTHLGSLRKVVRVFSRHYRGQLLAINSEYNMPIFMTPNHVVFAKVPGKGEKRINIKSTGFDGITRDIEMRLRGRRRIVWIRASKLKINDLLYIPKLPKKPQDGIRTIYYIPIKMIIGDSSGLIKIKRQLTWKSAHKSAKKIRESLPLSPEMLRVLGYYIAEGSANFSSNQISFAFNASENHLVDDLLEAMKEIFGIEGSVKENENFFKITFSSKTLMLLFSKMCGVGARNKKLPYFFTLLSKMQLRELVKGCWLGDGSNERYSTMSKYLAHQLRLALLRLGILTSIRKDKTSRYHLTVAGVSKDKFTETFGIKCKIPYVKKCVHAREISELSSNELSDSQYGHSRAGGFWIPIKSIKTIPYNGLVYDLQVEGDSSYVVCGVAVHNSPRDSSFRWNYQNQPPELWEQYNKIKESGEMHFRIHPLLHWKEIDIWRYIKRENLPIVGLYFSKNGFRYRSIGCKPCCSPIPSNASNVDEIIAELETTKTAERAGRAQDKEQAYMMQKLRALGYM